MCPLPSIEEILKSQFSQLALSVGPISVEHAGDTIFDTVNFAVSQDLNYTAVSPVVM